MALRSSSRLSAKRSAPETATMDSPPPAPKKMKKYNFGASSMRCKRRLTYSDDEKEDQDLGGNFLSDDGPSSPSPKRSKLEHSELTIFSPCPSMDDLAPHSRDSVILPDVAQAPEANEADSSTQSEEEDAEANLISEEEAELIYNTNLDDLQNHLLDSDVDSFDYKQTRNRLAINLLSEQEEVARNLIDDARNFLHDSFNMNNPAEREELQNKLLILDLLCDMIGLTRGH